MPSGPGVAIVGAGPAGLVVAHLLQREAIPFVVFERQTLAELARRPKAGLVEYRTVQLLAREGIAGSTLQFTAENHRSEFRTPRGILGALLGEVPVIAVLGASRFHEDVVTGAATVCHSHIGTRAFLDVAE